MIVCSHVTSSAASDSVCGQSNQIGTAEFVDQMKKLAGDPEEIRLNKATKEADVDAELAALKAKLGD